MNEITNAFTENQQMLPQLFQSLNMMSATISTLQNEVQNLNLARNTVPPASTTAPPGVTFQPEQQQPMQQPYYPTYGTKNTAHLQQGMYPVVQNHQQFAQQPNQGRRSNTGRDGHAGRGNNGSQGQQQAHGAPKARYYCWSHGMCNHTSTSCESPMQSHQYHATFQNRCNGSARGCQRFEA
jgi:hypothetical protein